MERPIEFRGKRKDNGEWVYGYYAQSKAGLSYIYCNNGHLEYSFVEVLPETVGQFTGLLDKNGKKIWEGDKVKQILENNLIRIGKIDLHEGAFRVVGDDETYDYLHNLTRFLPEYGIEVIGNIHEEDK